MNVTEFPDLTRAREEAAAWVARIDRGLMPAEHAQLRQWCAASPANARALRQVSEMWAGLDVMKALPRLLPEIEADADANASQAVAAAPAPAPRRRMAMAAVAAGLAVGTAALWAWRMPAENPPVLASVTTATYATAVGEHREVSLADGSSLSINTNSEVQVVSLEGSTRELRLVRGEALFTVAPDPARPFRVTVGGRLVEAVGTAFDIRLHDAGHVDVVVTHGRIRLQSGIVTDHADRGDAVSIATDGGLRVRRLDEQAIKDRLAWRQGMIAFGGQPLSEALEEFSRYTPARLVVTDAATGRRPIGGTVRAGDVPSLLEALRTNLGLESQRAPDGSIRIGPER